MELVRNFTKLSKTDAPIAGGKGASLGEMTQVGIPVPPGFVVLSESFEQFIRETGLVQEIDAILHKVNHKEIGTVESASEAIRALILRAEMPKDIATEISRSFKILNTKYVAVRSSATAEDGMDHAWAGQLESYLNTKEDDVLTKVKLCWSSLFTPRAIFYRFEKSLHSMKISVAVVVQKMVESEVSGIAFSVHPVTEDWNQLIIEAGFGLGEAIVSGSVTPDSYVVEKNPRNILDINVSTQDRGLYRAEHASAEHGNNEWRDIPEPKASSQVLTEKQILELSEIILGIEKHYGFPCDIEWAFEKGKFYIVQSRPITTLAKKKDDKADREKWISVGKDFNTPASKNYIFASSFLVQSKMFGTPLVRLGVCSKNNDIDFISLISTWNAAKEEFQSKIKKDIYFVDTLIDKTNLTGEEFNLWSENNIFNKDLSGLSDEQLVSLMKEFVEKQAEMYALGTVLPLLDLNDFPYVEGNLRKILEAKLSEKKAKEYYQVLTEPIKNSFAQDQEEDLLRLMSKYSKKDLMSFVKDSSLDEVHNKFPKFYDDLKNHTKKHGWVYYVFIGPAFTEGQFLEFIKNNVEKGIDPKKRLSEISSHKNKVVELKEKYIQELKPNEFENMILNLASKMVWGKPRRKDYQSKSYYHLEKLQLEIAKRLSLGLDEVRCVPYTLLEQAFGKDGVDKVLEDIYEEHVFVQDPEGKIQFLYGSEAKDFAEKNIESPKEHSHTGEYIKGTTACHGKAKGIVRIINKPQDMDKMKQGDILVSAATTPSIVPAMKKAAAIVTDEGGLTCHAAIVSRELNTPCVIGTKVATQILKDGDEVEVDADKGIVRIIKNKNQFVSPELKDFNPDDYLFYGLWRQDVFSAYLWADPWVPELIEKLGLHFEYPATVILYGGNFFLKKPELKRLRDQICEKITNRDEDFFKNVISVADGVYKMSGEVGQSFRAKEPNLKNFQEFVNAAKNIILLWSLGAEHFAYAAEGKLQETVVRESFPAEHVMQIIPKVITPLYYRHKDLVQLKKEIGNKSFGEIRKDKRLYQKLKDQVEKYPWVEVFNLIGEPMTPERLYGQIEHMQDVTEDSEYIPKKSLSPELVFRAKCMHYSGYIKQAGAEYFSIFSEKTLPFLNKIAQKIGVTYRELMALTIVEVEQALGGKIKVNDLKRRAQVRKDFNWIMISKEDGGMLFLEEPADIELLKEKMIPRADKSVREIKGEVGSPGKYTGPVRVIMNTDDFSKMKAGDVLVSTMTTPDFVILMQMAGAIVTDIGGLLCHAAIVSREIKTPCVIGTRFATQILKDGDMVEVDADKGIVKILDTKKDDIKMLKKNEYRFTVRRAYAPVFMEPILHGQAISRNFEGILNKKFIFNHCIACEADIYYSIRELEELEKVTFDSWKSKKEFTKAKKILLEREENLLKVASGADFEKFCRAMEEYTPALMTVVTVSGSIERSIRESLSKKVSKEEVDHIMDKLNIPLEDNFYKKEEYDLVTTKNLKKHIKEYEWIKSRYGNRNPYTIEAANLSLSKIDKISFLQHWKQEKEATKSMIEKAKKLTGEDNLIDIMQFIVYYRTQRTDIFNKSIYLFIPYLTKLAEEKGLTYEQLIHCTEEEVRGVLPPKKIIEERIKAYSQIMFDGKVITYSGEENKKIKDYLKEDVSGVKEIKGVSAQKGLAKGKVKIILNKKDFDKIQDGDVLVTSMTTPDMVSTMKKAVAFITDEGGITCHAAIISREMKTPCIIGTKIATKVLKDGDMVEVDADKGIVKIIK